MPNIAAVLKDEIARLARKEVRAETTALKKQSLAYRSDIAMLKKQVKNLERLARVSAKPASVAGESEKDMEASHGTRFSAKGFAAQRKRLGLSAAESGTLLNCSAQSVYKWEQGTSRPRASTMPAIIALRKLSKSQAAAVLASL
jgi:DNA-binding transcriptional regulator YiaG